MRKSILLLLILSGFLLTLTACSSGGEDAAPDTTEVAEETTTTVDEAITPPTIAPGSSPELGSIEWVVQDVGPECAEAVAPIRELYEVYASGLDMDEPSRQILNEGLAAGFGACDPDEWERFQTLELQGWMNDIPESLGG